MGVTAFMRGAIVVTGLFLVAGSIWFHAKKKMTLDLAVAWCLLGIAITLVGAVPLLSRWLGLISIWTGAALLCVGVACLLGAFRICLLISPLSYPAIFRARCRNCRSTEDSAALTATAL